MIHSTHRRIRRATRQTGGQAEGNTSHKPGLPTRVQGLRVVGWKELAGSTSRNHAGSRPHPPSRLQQAQKKLGKRIQTLRQQHGLTRDQLGSDCGLPIAMMKKIEDGQIDIDLFIMIRFANRLGTKLHRLFRGIE